MEAKKKIKLIDIKEFDVLLYEVKLFGITLFYHAAWFAGSKWGIKCNFESLAKGPELQEWRLGRRPKYVCRVKMGLTRKQKDIIRNECAKLAVLGYDWRSIGIAILTLGLVSGAGRSNNRIRCDENIELPLIRAGLDPQLPVKRPIGFTQSPIMNVYEVG